ncbi:uncharacterized protein N7482_002064 [Penicillium canariense]|uniref:BZIP domain-containing protein n=1 Tax=Penicillium canariense TaxID=189055 RepID=A0A9W9IGY3_9EURO|nr:uncharacterized protein N7482_002064 [Penicillium canariense]KAJ5176187.1 hypothetical protein N7482_002064 [Penicillium canariense]
MPGSNHSPSDLPLSETLSARSYLELARQGFQLQLQPEDHTPPSILESPLLEAPIESESKSGPRLRPRERRPVRKDSEKTETAPDDRPARKRGRPRLETAKDAAAIEERRLQIRRAQRTYRQKKEATIQTLKTRVELLEQTLQNVSDLLVSVDDDVVSSRTGHSDLSRARQLVLAEIDRARELPADSSHQLGQTPGSLPDVFGYQVALARRDIHGETSSCKHVHEKSNPTHPHPRSPSPLLNRLFPSTTIYTYSYQESDLSRRLQRFCLEHTYRWLADAHSDPTLMSRVFGLLPCIQDMPGVRRNFRRVLQTEIGGPLEVNKLPFYTLGGAGTHFPRSGTDGRPVYPENSRRPGKILRRLARILRRGGISDWDEDWSGDLEPDLGDEQGEEVRSMSEDDRLRALDLEGEWFDCHDVQGYLEHCGIIADGSSLWVEVPAATVDALYSPSPGRASDYSASQFYVSPGELSSSDISEPQYLGQSTHILDVESFFDCECGRHPAFSINLSHRLKPSLVLLANFRILGRAPGFRLWDVDAALRTAIHRRSF